MDRVAPADVMASPHEVSASFFFVYFVDKAQQHIGQIKWNGGFCGNSTPCPGLTDGHVFLLASGHPVWFDTPEFWVFLVNKWFLGIFFRGSDLARSTAEEQGCNAWHARTWSTNVFCFSTLEYSNIGSLSQAFARLGDPTC
jgi:hypothetical protein